MKCVCLIGKPNVGKSTIFNKLIKEKKSIIMDEPGVTRDRIYGDVSYEDKTFLLIDTGGIDLGEGDFNKDIKMQAALAIDEADLILFIVDGKNGLDASDYYIRDMLIRSEKEVIVVVNKLDNQKRNDAIYELFQFCLNDYPIIEKHEKINFYIN